MEYKGYRAIVEFDDSAEVFHGEVVNTRDVITFSGRSVAELRQAMRDSIEDYCAWCIERGKQPEKPFSGKFVLRLEPQLHRAVTLAARQAGMSLNAWAATRLAKAAEGHGLAQSRRSTKATRARAKTRSAPLGSKGA
jgi:predicted HicB family RNase H-like nuclease